MRFHQFALCCLFSAIAAPALANNIVTNGTFASPVLAPSPPGLGYNVALPVSQNGNNLITDWGVFGVDAGVFFTNSSGAQGAFIDAGSTLYQDLGPLSPNTRYTLNLLSRQTGDQPAEVGTLTENLATGTGDPNTIVDFSSFAVHATTVTPGSTFAALSPWTLTTGSVVNGDLFVLLSTSATGLGDGRTPQLYVEDVEVSAEPVPEPSTTAFLDVSLLGLTTYQLARRHRKSAQIPG